jgi:hypothetical protein
MRLKNRKYPFLKFLFFRKGLILAIFALPLGCINSVLGPIGENTTAPNLTHKGYWIANEGGFTLGQASLSYLDLVEDTVYNYVFEAVNNRPLGDVLQSINYYKVKAYLIINNSQKIEVVDSITFQSIATITDLSSPRELVGYADKLFISNLYSNQIDVIDADNFNLIDEIETGGWNEKMLLWGNELLVTQRQTFINNVPGNTKGLWKINAQTNELIDFVDLAQGANSIVLDKNQKIWVLCDGGLEEEIGGLYKIDYATFEIESIIPFPTIEYAGSLLQIDVAREHLYFILSDPEEGVNAYDILKMSIENTELPETPFYDGGNLYIYGFYVDEIQQELLFTDAVGLIQEGYCYRIDITDKSIIAKYPAGIFPGQIYPRY